MLPFVLYQEVQTDAPLPKSCRAAPGTDVKIRRQQFVDAVCFAVSDACGNLSLKPTEASHILAAESRPVPRTLSACSMPV